MTMAEELALNFLSGDGEENDDLDSLFGGGDGDTELASLFTDAGADVEPSQEPDCEPASPSSQERPQQATNYVAQLSLPEVQAQVQSDHQHAFSLPLLHLPAVPDPPGTSLSHQDGHTSGGLVVSTQDPAHTAFGLALTPTSSEDTTGDAALEAELAGLWEFIASQDQPVNAHAGSQVSDATQDDNVILPTQIPGFRYAKSNTNSYIRLPRRIDLDYKQAEELMYYITLSKHPRPVSFSRQI